MQNRARWTATLVGIAIVALFVVSFLAGHEFRGRQRSLDAGGHSGTYLGRRASKGSDAVSHAVGRQGTAPTLAP